MTQADRFSEEEVSTGFVGCRSVLLRVFLGVQPNTLSSHPHPDQSSLDAEMVSPLTPWIRTRRRGWLWVPGLWPGLCPPPRCLQLHSDFLGRPPALAPIWPWSRLTPCSFPRSSRCLPLSHQMCVAT